MCSKEHLFIHEEENLCHILNMSTFAGSILNKGFKGIYQLFLYIYSLLSIPEVMK